MTEKRTLIVGVRSGNIGDEIRHSMHYVDQATNYAVEKREVHYPDMETLDVTKPTSIDNFMFYNGAFDEIIYCAGYNKLNWIGDLYTQQFELRRHYEVNVLGFVNLLSRHVSLFPAKQMRVLAITSDAARNPMRGSLAYCSSKAALEMSIKCMAREWAGQHWVAGLSPAIVEDTPMSAEIDEAVPGFRGWAPEAAAAYEKSMLPLGRRVTKREIAETATWLVTQAPEYMTGSIVNITGGK